jgi:hypothetical protein
MNAPTDLALLVLLDVFRSVAMDCMLTLAAIGAVPALVLLAILLKIDSRKAGLGPSRFRETS